jgi:glycosyltransferase involved in cell wall biosynthesis
MSPNFVLVDICIPMDGSMRRGRAEVGPVNMPVSNESLAVVDSRVAGLPKLHDVVFIGALYPYRVELLDTLRAQGVRVAVNPHREDRTRDLEESRRNQPSYLDYMVGLAQSHMALNFSDSSAGPYQQLKTRVLEASAVGCLILTDDVDRTELFWTPEAEYGYFETLADVPALVERFLSDPEKLSRAQESARRRAREINVTSFWGGIEQVLEKRQLPAVMPD